MAGLADLLPQVVRQLPEWSGRLNVRRSEWVTVRLWPDPEIFGINLLAENQPFDYT